MNALVELSDALVREDKYDFKPFKLKAGTSYFPGLGVSYLDEENLPILVFPDNKVSVSLKISLLAFSVFNYCLNEYGGVYNPKLLMETLIKTKEYIDVLHTMDCIYLNQEGMWDFNQDHVAIVSINDYEDLEALTQMFLEEDKEN